MLENRQVYDRYVSICFNGDFNDSVTHKPKNCNGYVIKF